MTEDFKKLAVEAFKLNLKIKKNTLELKKMKIELREKMINANAKKHQGRINLLKGFLMGRGIPFKDGLWDWQTRNLN